MDGPASRQQSRIAERRGANGSDHQGIGFKLKSLHSGQLRSTGVLRWVIASLTRSPNARANG
jgi:hypothetical protein